MTHPQFRELYGCSRKHATRLLVAEIMAHLDCLVSRLTGLHHTSRGIKEAIFCALVGPCGPRPLREAAEAAAQVLIDHAEKQGRWPRIDRGLQDTEETADDHDY